MKVRSITLGVIMALVLESEVCAGGAKQQQQQQSGGGLTLDVPAIQSLSSQDSD
jgi:hypothetical protein